jgi:hypothetical protein
MPVLNGGTTSYAEDKTFRPRTTVDDINQIPDYGLSFDVPDDYNLKPREFAFDNGKDLGALLPEKVDRNFMICRYERLFKYKVETTHPQYYLVPWMAVPAKRSPSNDQWQLDQPIFLLNVRLVKDYADIANSGKAGRHLQLVSSADINAYWDDQNKTATRFEPNVAKLKTDPTPVVVVIGDGAHDGGGNIIIKDLDDAGKIVGKLNIVFLRKLVQQAFLINVTKTSDYFEFERTTADTFETLETDGLSAAFAHGPLIKGVNDFGFKQIGLELDIADDGFDMYAPDGNKLMRAQDNATALTHRISNTLLQITGQTSVSTMDRAAALCLKFFESVASLKNSSGTEVGKFSRLYIFTTPLYVLDEDGSSVDGVNVGELALTTEPPGQLTRSTAKFVIETPLQATLFHEINESDFPGMSFHDRHYTYKTLAHEVSHALLVNHHFDKPEYYEINSGGLVQKKVKYENLFAANGRLRLYLSGKPVDDITKTYDVDKVRIDDFIVSGPNVTLFDRIIDIGMKPAIDEFIDQKIFTVTRPSFWSSPASAEAPIADLIIWISLDDLVKFNKYSTKNIMDYGSKNTQFNIGVTPHEAYLDRAPVNFSRFQWELLRQTVERFR